MAKRLSGDPPLAVDMPDASRRVAEVKALQRALSAKNFNPGPVDGYFGYGTQAAVIAFQRSEGLLADGVVGPRTAAALNGANAAALPNVTGGVTLAVVSRMFPHTPIGNIERNLPPVLSALEAQQLHDRLMVMMALATIRAETESFEPIAEGRSRYNTSPDGGHAFDLYDYRADLGNQGPPDGERFRGRGFIQLTGRYNYEHYGALVHERLADQPELASDATIAAQLLALFLFEKERRIKEALLDWDFYAARRLVNGGTHGVDRFIDAYRIGMSLTA